jgi:hypothetical protein
MPMSDGHVIAPGATFGFVGLGRMGNPMSGRLPADADHTEIARWLGT